MQLCIPKDRGIILLTPANNVIVSCEPGSQHHTLSFFCVSLTRWSNLQVGFTYGVRYGYRTYRSTCFRGSRTAFSFSKRVRPGVTLVRYVRCERLLNRAYQRWWRSSGNSGRTLDGRGSSQSCLLTGDWRGHLKVQMTCTVVCWRVICSFWHVFRRVLSIALVIVRNLRWLGAMDWLIVMSAFALVLGRRYTPRGRDSLAR